MTLLNFSHPLPPSQIATIEHLTGQAVDRVLDVKTQFDHAQSFPVQAKTLLEAELHGRMGYFPLDHAA